LHYVYDWSGRNSVAAVVGPVNESVWEHLKLGYWALILFSSFEFKLFDRKVNNFFLAKLVGVVLLNLTILTIYYTYSALTPHNIIWLDISSYIIGVIICQWVAYRLYFTSEFVILKLPSLLLFVAIGVLFGYFTFHPPHKEIFKDERNGTYGVPLSSISHNSGKPILYQDQSL
jgi:hypothetical protein